MMDLFDTPGEELPASDAPRPLADRLRPRLLADVIGQRQILGPEAPLTVMLKANALGSIIFWGPPGVGKTTIARLLAEETDLKFVQISAIFSGVPELRKVFQAAQNRRDNGQGTLLFVDEIHRFNKAQQDSFLPLMEDGTLVLVGATTENPSFELNAAVLSRAQVLVLERLSADELELLVQRAETEAGRVLPLEAGARRAVLEMADGDGRSLLNLIEQINKDFNLANESIDLPQDIQPEELKNELHEKIYRLIQYKFAEYLNLLYIVDVPEDQIKKLDGSDIAELAKQVAFLILKREWMKVWFRNKYQ